MPHSQSAKKRLRQSEKRRLANRSLKSAIKTYIKRLEDAIGRGDLEAAQRELSIINKSLDKAAKKHIYHKNTAARKKSQLARKVNQLKAMSAHA